MITESTTATADLSAKLDEAKLRRPDFQPGQEVILGDGQVWSLPCPKVAYVPAFDDAGEMYAQVVSSFGAEFQAEVDVFEIAATTTAEALAFFHVGAALLDRNYDLTRDQLQALLRYQVGGDQDRQAVLDVFRIALGRGVVTPPAEVDSSTLAA